MKKLILILIFYPILSFSQIGINTTLPEAALDVSSTTNGILIPRIGLNSLNTEVPIVNPNGGLLATSTLVYNTNNALGTGFYYWNGGTWVKLTDGIQSGTIASTPTLIEPNAIIPGSIGPVGPLTNVGTNSIAASFDAATITRTINVTGIIGNTANITCNVQLNHTWGSDIDLYLQSPTGQIIELNTDNGGFIPTTFDVTFSDAGASNITTWLGGNITGTYRPQGTLTTDVIVPNITTMAGFNGVSPNGTWTLHLRDDAFIDTFNFTNFSLSIATYSVIPLTYRLIGETSMAYLSGSNIITNATYSSNPIDNEGIVTALTRSTASAGAIGTTAATPAGTIISYASDSPRQGSGNYWTTTYNQAVSNGLINNTTYYFQLWAKANIETPTASNEIFSLIPMRIPQ